MTRKRKKERKKERERDRKAKTFLQQTSIAYNILIRTEACEEMISYFFEWGDGE